MKRKVVFKILCIFLLAPLALMALAVVGILIFFPRSIPAENLVIEGTPDQLERGRYLVNHVAFCMNCHGERDWSRMSGPVMAGTLGKGARNPIFSDGDVYSANITPFALADWSDGELKRAITSGLKPDGRPVHPEMPHFIYNRMAEPDVHAIIAYLRTLNPIEHTPPKPHSPFWIGLAARILPKPYEPVPLPNRSDPVAYGGYLVQIAECRSCHGSNLTGGLTLHIPGGMEVESINLTPVPGSRIGSWSREEFIAMFKLMADPVAQQRKVPEGGVNSVMPWIQYSGMSEADLSAIYAYLRTVPPKTP